MKLPRILTPHTVTVRPWEGEGAYGDIFGTPRTLTSVRVEETTRLVRDKTGAEVVSSARVFIRPEHAPVPVDSEVTLPSGRVAVVLAVAHHHTPPAPEHYELALT